MQAVHFYWGFVWTFLMFLQVNGSKYVTLSHNGPVVLGATITFRADVYEENGGRPSGGFRYKWKDNALTPHEYETMSNATSYWSIDYPPESNSVGIYEVEVVVSEWIIFKIWQTSIRVQFQITQFLNGNITVMQSNKTLENSYVSTASEAKLMVNLRRPDNDYIKKKATAISTYWFMDCKYYGQTNDLNFVYNFTNPNVSHIIEALVVASYEPPTTTTVLPPTTTTSVPPTTSPASNVTQNSSTTAVIPSTTASTTTTTTLTSTKATETSTTASVVVDPTLNNTSADLGNISVPYICLNSSIIPPDPNKTYGHFMKKIDVRAPITNISVEGTNWIQPWDMLSLNVTCKGSGPFNKCLQFHRGIYNATGNETCEDADHLHSCNFSIIHYFLEPSVYTILVIINNEINKQIYTLTINIYKVTTKPQLSVIVVPVSCSLAAVVLIIFGVAYYIQSRARFTIEVADFDFGENNPEMEYKTFRERLRDSFNNTIRPGGKRISVRQPYYGSMNH